MDQPAAKQTCLLDPAIGIVKYDKLIKKVVNGVELTFSVCGTCSLLLKGAKPTDYSKNMHEGGKDHQAALRRSKSTHRQMSIRGIFARAAPPGAGSGSAPASVIEHPMPAIARIAEASLFNQAVAEAGAVNPGPAICTILCNHPTSITKHSQRTVVNSALFCSFNLWCLHTETLQRCHACVLSCQLL